MKLLLALALSLWLSVAHAQTPGCTFQTPPCVQTSVFVASASAPLAASSVSANIPFPAQGSALTALITNNGAALVYVLSGGTGVIATVNPPSTPIPPGQTIALPQGLYTNIAAITAAGTSSLTVQSGTGVPVLVYGQVSVLGGITITPSQRTIVPLDVSTVTTGGTAITALNTGHATAGGWLSTANSAGMCVDQVTGAGTVTGTPSTTACVAANQPYQLVPGTHAVSVNSTGSAVNIAGVGLQ